MPMKCSNTVKLIWWFIQHWILPTLAGTLLVNLPRFLLSNVTFFYTNGFICLPTRHCQHLCANNYWALVTKWNSNLLHMGEIFKGFMLVENKIIKAETIIQNIISFLNKLCFPLLRFLSLLIYLYFVYVYYYLDSCTLCIYNFLS